MLQIVGSVARQHVHGRDQLGVGVHDDGRLVPVAQLRVMHRQQPVRIGHYLSQQCRPRFAVRPVDRRLALDAGTQVPLVPLGFGPFRQDGVRHGRQGPQQFDDAVRQQIIGVLHRAQSQDAGRVQRHPHPTLFQVA